MFSLPLLAILNAHVLQGVPQGRAINLVRSAVPAPAYGYNPYCDDSEQGEYDDYPEWCFRSHGLMLKKGPKINVNDARCVGRICFP
jgi:hypothetical protein